MTDTPADDSRHRPKRRLSRPLLIGGAAAAATLVVSLGVGAVLLPGDDRPAERTAADAPSAVAPDGPEQTGAAPPADALAPELGQPVGRRRPRASRSPARRRRPRRSPSRTTAPSRQRDPRQRAEQHRRPDHLLPGAARAPSSQQVVDLVNQERAKAGCKALSVNDQADARRPAAQPGPGRPQEDDARPAATAATSASGSTGSATPGARTARTSPGTSRAPAAVMDAWMNLRGHRANILNCTFTEIGVGVASSNGPYWTQDFGTPR